MATIADKASRRWEMHHPALLGALSLGGVMLAGPRAFAYAEMHHWKVDQLYTCVFTLATVFTAFLFTFYTFVVTAERGFLARAKSSIYFKQTVRYTLSAIWVGGIVCAATVPLLVVQPTPTVGDPWLVVVAIWAALTVWACASFIRAAYLFSIFAGNQTQA
jgi:hypothetical protein